MRLSVPEDLDTILTALQEESYWHLDSIWSSAINNSDHKTSWRMMSTYAKEVNVEYHILLHDLR